MKICLIGMDERTRQSLSLLFRHRTGGAVVLSGEDVADIAILDLDQKSALDSYYAVRAHRPELQAIGLSAKAGLIVEDIHVLGKPIAANGLLQAIQTISNSGPLAGSVVAAETASFLSTRIGGSRRKVETTMPPTQEKQFFNPNAHLLGSILDAAAEAEKKGLVAVASFYGDRLILVDAKAGLIQTNLSSSQARAFALSAFEGDSEGKTPNTVGLQHPVVEYVTRDEASDRYDDKTYYVPREIFMWKLGAMTSRGRLIAHTKSSERVYLRRWPNMTRFSYSDNDMRIVAYWVRQPCSMDEIVEALGVSAQEVFTVYTAAYAAGLAGKACREVDELWEAPEVTEHRERGLFSSIMKRLLQRKPASNVEGAEA
jgi:hypothetical protein